jgi:hypothetical protein
VSGFRSFKKPLHRRPRLSRDSLTEEFLYFTSGTFFPRTVKKPRGKKSRRVGPLEEGLHIAPVETSWLARTSGREYRGAHTRAWTTKTTALMRTYYFVRYTSRVSHLFLLCKSALHKQFHAPPVPSPQPTQPYSWLRAPALASLWSPIQLTCTMRASGGSLLILQSIALKLRGNRRSQHQDCATDLAAPYAKKTLAKASAS